MPRSRRRGPITTPVPSRPSGRRRVRRPSSRARRKAPTDTVGSMSWAAASPRTTSSTICEASWSSAVHAKSGARKRSRRARAHLTCAAQVGSPGGRMARSMAATCSAMAWASSMSRRMAARRASLRSPAVSRWAS